MTFFSASPTIIWKLSIGLGGVGGSFEYVRSLIVKSLVLTGLLEAQADFQIHCQ